MENARGCEVGALVSLVAMVLIAISVLASPVKDISLLANISAVQSPSSHAH